MPERARIPRHCFQKRLHEPLETVALVAFGKGNGAVPGKDILKGHGAFSLKKRWHVSIAGNARKGNGEKQKRGERKKEGRKALWLPCPAAIDGP